MIGRWKYLVIPVAGIAVLSGCATIPTGPSVMVLPGTGKSFEQFQYDDNACKQFAYQQVGITANESGAQNAVGGAVIGTMLGAAAGAVIGAATGNPAAGAAIGAGTGLVGGTAVGASNSYAAMGSVQYRYDGAYQQCMYAKGNQIPGTVQRNYRQSSYPPPPPPPNGAGTAPPPVVAPPASGGIPSASTSTSVNIPPPPPGTPPPPPPGVTR